LKKIRILHTADLHLDTSFFTTENNAELLKYELLETFGRITDIAKEYKVDIMIVCGDVTDGGTLSDAAYNTLYKGLEKLGIPVFMIMGNHDCGFNYKLPQNVYLFSGMQKYSFGNADIYGSDFEHGFENISVDDSKINIVLQHGTVGGNSDNPITLANISETKADYFALGHIHSFDGLKKSGDTYYAYSGVPVGRGFDEQGKKGIIIADVEKGNVSVEFLSVSKRQYCEVPVDITNCRDYVEVLEKLKGYETDNLYKFRLKGTPAGYIDFHSLKAVTDREFFYVKIIDETIARVDIKALSEEETLAGYFVKNALLNGGDDEVIKYGLSALKGERIYIDENKKSIY